MGNRLIDSLNRYMPKDNRLAKLAQEMTHTPQAPIESLKGRDGLTDWALGVRERTLNPLQAMANYANEFKGLDPVDMGMQMVGGGMAGTIGKIANKTEFELAHELAQKNAVDMLGLPPTNTAMDRARAMGFDGDFAHFSRHGADVQELDSGKYAIAPFDAVGTHVGSQEQALDRFNKTVGYKVNNPMYANDELKGVTYPLMIRKGNPMLGDDGKVMSESPIGMKFSETADYGDLRASNDVLRKSIFSQYDSIPYINEVEAAGQISHIAPPNNLRSRFAAFDPAQRNSANLLAGYGAGGLGLAALLNQNEQDSYY